MDELTKAKRRALYLLEHSDRTEAELRKKLLKNYAPETAEAAIAYVKGFRYVDDKRYAVNYLNSRGSTKSYRQLEQELLFRKGISREVLEEAKEEAEEQDERQLIRDWMRRKHVIPREASREELRRFYGFLMRRGFRREDIMSVLRLEEES